MNIQMKEVVICRSTADHEVSIGLRFDRVPDNG